MSVDFTAFDAQVTGANGAAGSASGNIDGGDGGNAIDSLSPYSNTDFSLEPSLNRVFPTVTAGNGGAGAGGANATATTPALQGGAGGKGGAALISMDHDIFGSAATPYVGFVTITMSVDAAAIGSAGGDSGGVGGAGGRGGLGITAVTGVNGSQGSLGSDGAIGGVGGVGEIANANLNAMTSYATSDLQIQLISNGGKGGKGGFGGSGGGGSLSAGNGADGAQAGAGAPAEATFSGATAFNDSAIFVTEKPTGGFGGSGGNGGNGGTLGPAGSPPAGFGANGNGGAGGAGGGASATVSGDTLTAPSVQFTLNADGGQGGAGGLGGNAGPAHGLNGAAGSDGAGSITFTNNVITVGSGIPGDTQLSGNDLLLLNLRVATIGPAGFFVPGTLNGGVGGNLTFSGNTFIGDGQSRLVLQLGSTGTAVVDTIANTISIDGSATSNTISGFTKFMLDTNDVFVAGGGNYQVTFAPDPDTLVVTPNSGNVTLAGITSTNFLLDFRGFGPSFDLVALAADTHTSNGSTVITLSPTSTITLQGYTGGIASGDVIFEPLPTVVTETASVVAGGVKTGTAGTAGTGALAGDSDLSGFSLAISAISGGALGVSTAGAYGHLTLNADGSYSYSADMSDAIAGAPSGSQPIDTFTFTVSDGHGGTINSTLKFTIDNAPPVTTAPASEIASKGTPFAFSGANLISVADPDASSGPGENITVVLTDTTGLLSAFVAGSGSGASITGSGTQQLTISGGLGQVNTALATLSFLSNSLGADQIDVATSDGRGGSDDHKIAVSVVANLPPVTTVPASEIASKGTPFAFTGADQISVADPDAQSGPGETITVVLTDTAGLLSAFVAGSGGGAGIAGNGTQQLTISGGLGQVNAALATLSFLGNSLGADQIDVATSDGRGGSDDHKIAVNVVANLPPVTTAPASEIASKDTPFAFTGANLISVADPDAQSGPGENITVVLTDTTGLLSAFVAGSGGGASIAGSGTQQLTISGGLGQVNTALATLSFLGDTVGPDQIDVATSDGRGGSDDHKIAITVTPSTNVPFSIVAPSSAMTGVNQAGSISGISLVENPTTPGETFSIVIADGHGVLSASTLVAGGGGTIVNNDANTLTITGTLDQVNADLTTLTDTNTSTIHDSLFMLASNSNGENAPVVLVDVTVNEAPTITTPSDVRAAAGIATPVPLMKVSETGNTAGEFFVVILSDVTGLLSATLGGNPVLGSGTNHLTLSGSLDQINAQLASLAITETAVGLDFITGGVGDGFGNVSGQFVIPVVGEKTWTSTSDNGPENWNNAENWTTPGAPVAGQDIFIPGTGIQPVIFNGASGTIGGIVTNNGTITLDSAGLLTTLQVDGNVSLQGAGSVVLSDASTNFIAAVGTSTLENGQTISGSGQIDLFTDFTSTATFHNDFNGTVNATGINSLVFEGSLGLPPGQVVNDGLMEASSNGGLFLEAVKVTNHGTIQANNGSHIDLGSSSVVSGGTLITTGTGVIRSESAVDKGLGEPGPTLDGLSNGALTNLGNIEVGNRHTLRVEGTIDNEGVISLLGTSTNSAGLIVSDNATLIGDGTVELSDSRLNEITADTLFNGNSTLDNFETISGAGHIDLFASFTDTLTFHNDISGTVNATGTNSLVIAGELSLFSGQVINDGLMETSGTGGLFLEAVNLTNKGTIQANNGSHIDLGSSTAIFGGTLRTAGNGVIRSESTADKGFGEPGPTLDGLSNGALTNLGNIEVGNNHTLRVEGTIDNEGVISLLGTSTNSAGLIVSGNATLIGDGIVELSDSRLNEITADTLFNGNSTLDNFETISGAGHIDLFASFTDTLTFHNDISGTVNATGTNSLVISGEASLFSGQVINDGLMEASGTGGLVFDNTSIANNNGLIEASSGSHVDFVNAQLSGAGGLIFIDPNATATFSNASAASGQTIQFLKGTNETLVLDDATINGTTIGAHISGFAIGDKINLTQLKVTSAMIDGSARVHLFSGTTEIGSLQLDSSNLGERFVVTGEGGAGTLLTIGVSTPPQVTEMLARDTGASATDGITNDPTLQGTGDAFADVSFSEGTTSIGTTTADATGAWSFTPTNLSQGPHTIIASENNVAGTGHASLTLSYDSLAPHMAITTPDSQVANPQLTLSGTGEAGTQVQLFDNALNIGGSVLVDATGHWSEQITLVGTGTHFITAADTDLAGNFGSSGVATFTLDNQIVAPISQLNVTGTTGADHITISQSNIVVGAGAGNDTITLTPGGNFQFHFLNGGPGNDTLDLSQIPSSVTANLEQGTLVGSQIGFSVLNSIENIIAGSGNESLIGSTGANVFQAGAGTDTITGHGGGDTFIFKPGFGKTVVTDFHAATTNANPHDFIELDHSLFPQFATIQALLASADVVQQGSSVVIIADAGHTIELQHTSVKTLVAHANDLLFV